jgi:hypothetical protein
LKEFRASLKAVDRDLPKAMRLALNDAANVIVDDSKPRVPHRSGRAAGTIKARSTQTKARVAGGGNRAPYYPWLDFGGAVGKRSSVRRPFLKNGRYIYDAYFRNRDRFRTVLENQLVNIVVNDGIKVD